MKPIATSGQLVPPRRALILIGTDTAYRAEAVIVGPWVHMTDARLRCGAAGFRPVADRSIRYSDIREIRWT